LIAKTFKVERNKWGEREKMAENAASNSGAKHSKQRLSMFYPPTTHNNNNNNNNYYYYYNSKSVHET
jgi:hypothetical protein